METKKKKLTKLQEMTKEQIRETLTKKRECNEKAQRIVETLIEKGITEEIFLQCLPDINQSHLEDVFEERALSQLCGYPLCLNNLDTKDIPKQTYRISVKTNKVYDITARKSFCCNSCFKAAMYAKKQMLTSPLWFREYEVIPKFTLLRSESVGSLGQEVDVSFVEKIQIKPMNNFISIYDFTNATLHDMDNSQHENDNLGCELLEPSNKKCEVSDSSNIKNLETGEPNSHATDLGQIETSHIQQNKCSKNSLNIIGDIIEKPDRKDDSYLLQNMPKTDSHSYINSKSSKHSKSKKQPLISALTIEVEKSLAEWFTIDTLLLIFGNEKVKEMLTDKGECIKEYLNNYSKSVYYNSNNYDQYQTLCKKLNMLDLEDKKFDMQSSQRESKPLPDYSIIQQESKKMQLKVRAFFTGETEYTDDVQCIPVDKENVADDTKLTQLPLVDKNSQNALRRRIVSDQLDKVLPDILRSLGLLSLSISSDVRQLVNSFQLKANNIMFKPIQWGLIAIIVIKLLSLRDKRLKHLLENPTAFNHMQLLLLSYKQDSGYLERLIAWLTDIDRLIDTNNTQLTIDT